MSTLKWLVAGDLHFPRHDPRLINMFFDVIKWWKPDAIDLSGDIDDAEGTSRWAADSVNEVSKPIEADMRILREFSYDLRQSAKQSEIHWHDGNHGWTRHDNYIKTKAKALDGLITPDMLYNLSDNGIEWHLYQDPPVQRFGNIHVHHGVAISKHGGQSVKADVEDWNVSLIRSHSHRQATYKKTVVFTDQDQTITQHLEGYEIGHLCKVSEMKYSSVHNWQAGFAIAHVESGSKATADGYWPHVQLIGISPDYSCVVDGRVFKG